MLAAERDALKWEAYHSSLNILEREMNVIISHLSNIAMVAALLIGFAFSALSEAMSTAEAEPWEEGLFTVSSCITIALMLYVIICSTLVASLGPEYGFKGKDGTAMRAAIELMKKDRGRAYTGFVLGIFSMIVAINSRVWIKMVSKANFGLSCGILCIIVLFMVYAARKITLSYPAQGATTSTTSAQQMSGADFVRSADNAAAIGGVTILGAN